MNHALEGPDGPGGEGQSPLGESRGSRVMVRAVHNGSDPASDPRREIPELGFRNYWYPVASARKVRKRKPLRVTILGDELCVFHGQSGIAVISNWCPHRGASIAGGMCHYEGTVSCPFHGWTFNEKGECVAVLSEGPGELTNIPGKVAVRSYPTRVIQGIVFAWMGDREPVPAEDDLPPELFDGSMVQHDATIWNANWRVSLENLSDNHTNYIHRNAIQVLLQPFMKVSYRGAKTYYEGGGAGLTFYSDGKERERPYREYFPEVDGYWPKHRYRMAWVPLFRPKPIRWLWRMGDGYPPKGTYHPNHEWNGGPHMPGQQRISGGSTMYTRWCVPIDKNTTKLFYMWACRPRNRVARAWERIKYPLNQKLLRHRNLGFQDGHILEELRFDLPERFSQYDVETIGWRRLAILSARYGGRHTDIPAEVIDQLNTRAKADMQGRIPAGTRILKDPVVTGTLDDPEILGTTSAGSPAPGPAGTP
jgi:phenylpropionate dioxygenase-like ring-hydroxylating dioxygenase large terminal subunit